MSKKILVVDDKKPICDILKRVLSREGYEVFSAYNGEEALKRLHKVAPDLMILDIIMPKMNGYEVCKRIRKDPCFKKLPILMFTGNDSEENRTKAFRAGADEYLTKPADLRKLIAAVKGLLKKS